MSAIHVHRLTEASRPKLHEHFLRLDANDVRLRFGAPLGPDAIAAYVDRIDFDTDALFGVYDDELGLAAAAHVAFGAEGAELGVSVLPAFRARGIGSALFARAVEHARNRFVTRMYMHCLSENAAMMHIASKSGMKICVDTGEAEAFLKLAPADQASLSGELMGQRLALFDYALKAQAAALRRVTGGSPA
ncbi:MAG: GNAT family N-acetyltransferase [Pseudomonadota bacterium]|nr:GNAT family N-acetyltransferase [Pseudomonadota bacterium]